MKFVWRGDRVHAFEDAKEPIERIKGYRYSLSAFTGLTGFWDKERESWGLSFFEMHLDRILYTAEYLQLDHGMDRDQLRQAVHEILRFNRPTDPFYVHIGVRSDDVGIRPVRGGPGKISIFLEGTGAYHPPEGIHAVVLDPEFRDDHQTSRAKYPRAIPYHLKLNSNYVQYGTMKTEAKEIYAERFEKESGPGAADGIVLGWQPGCREFFLTECTTSNLILVDKTDEITLIPKADFILDGITQRLTQRFAEEALGCKGRRARVHITEFREAIRSGDVTVFETGSSAGLTAIRSVDGVPVKKWSRLEELQALYERIRKGDEERYRDLVEWVESGPPSADEVIEHRETDRDIRTADLPFQEQA